ncbi:hypothetical protein AK812_SmicGene7991 [Symbiodinium microadriaticum]|uniref:Uncharacterized protein n=1 Tax=Symbiodinium microadriaticum TaxID=2951 RepID=A0A1Q9EM93_SYMMI|nr:hypothetical protein AK812_SmicGene7991 [Symbiodinium microadriaticum]CAE7555464.1 unnamed protein product [Symbiodinium microadriaticum]CAE7948298.1 unnamed protein product [Symbiodinium sp. KB8]
MYSLTTAAASKDAMDPGRGDYLAPTLAGLRAHEAHHSSQKPLHDQDHLESASTGMPDGSASFPVEQMPEAFEPATFTLWESEQVSLPASKEEAKASAKPSSQREVVTSVDEWFNLGEIFGCFMPRDKC